MDEREFNEYFTDKKLLNKSKKHMIAGARKIIKSEGLDEVIESLDKVPKELYYNNDIEGLSNYFTTAFNFLIKNRNKKLLGANLAGLAVIPQSALYATAGLSRLITGDAGASYSAGIIAFSLSVMGWFALSFMYNIIIDSRNKNRFTNNLSSLINSLS